MKKDIFADWLKELCMLVFVQTVQAFVFAIVMSLILSLLTGDYGSNNNVTGAVGIIAVVILASISKIEELIKKVFGIKSGVHDAGMRGGMKSLATTMLAANLAKGVLDNGKKFFGGIGDAVSTGIQSRRDLNLQRSRMARDLNRANQPAQISAGGGTPAPTASGGTGPSTGGNTSDASDPTSNEYYNRAVDARRNGDMDAYRYNMGLAVANASNGAGGNGSSNREAASSDMNSKLQDKIDAYNDKIEDIKRKRNSDIRKSLLNSASGIAETAGAIGFGAVGMTAGAALGEAKEIVQGGLTGMGVGDKIGSISMAPMKAAASLHETISENKRVNDELIKQANILNDQGNRIKSVRKAKKLLDEELSKLDVSDL